VLPHHRVLRPRCGVVDKTGDEMRRLRWVHLENEKGKRQTWSGRRELTITVGRRGGGEGGWRGGVSTVMRRSGDRRQPRPAPASPREQEGGE
jgi:hypothetical protein